MSSSAQLHIPYCKNKKHAKAKSTFFTFDLCSYTTNEYCKNENPASEPHPFYFNHPLLLSYPHLTPILILTLAYEFQNTGFKHCRQENGSMCILPMETSFGHWNMSLLSQDKNPIIGRIFAGNPNIQFFRCLPNRDVISSLNLPNSHDPNGGTYVRIGGLLKEK